MKTKSVIGPTPRTLDARNIGRNAIWERNTLRVAPSAISRALDLALKMLEEQDMDEEERPDWCTPAAIHSVISCAGLAAQKLSLVTTALVGEEDFSLAVGADGIAACVDALQAMAAQSGRTIAEEANRIILDALTRAGD